MSKAEAKLKEMGIILSEETSPVANYLTYKISGNQVFVSGQPPVGSQGMITGQIGSDLTFEQGYKAARQVGIQLLSTLKQASGGDLDRVSIVKVLGFVACAPGFYDAPKVINGCSDLLAEVLGENGQHARSAIPAVQLPYNVTIEIELVAELL